MSSPPESSSKVTQSPALRLLSWIVLIASIILVGYQLVHEWTDPPVAVQGDSPFLTRRDWEEAMIALDQGNRLPAELYLARSLGNPDLKTRRELLEGRLLLTDGKPLASQQCFAVSMTDATLRPFASHWMGAAAYATGNTPEAEKWWIEAIQLDAKLSVSHRSLAMYYYDVGANDQAIFYLNELANLEPADGRPWRLLGLLYKDYERYEDAVDKYRQALKRNLTDRSQQEVRIEFTECLIKTRNLQEALDTIVLATPTAATKALQAECLIGLGRQPEAETLLTESLKEDPKNVRALIQSGTLALESNKTNAAVGFFRSALQESPLDYSCHFKLSQALRKLQQNDEADKESAEAERIKLLREKFTKLHEDASANPKDAELRYQLGKAAIELQLPQVGINWFRAALQIDPQLKKAQEELDRMLPKP